MDGVPDLRDHNDFFSTNPVTNIDASLFFNTSKQWNISTNHAKMSQCVTAVLDSKQNYVWMETFVDFYSWVKNHKPMRIRLGFSCQARLNNSSRGDVQVM